ncbi:hypothetical protein [Methylobacterium marchantiae]|uniref:Permease n=1 Tax=Methylobacterium marchantiae TaxID=600331 RepID=A0ABW3WU37_9HYPH|nr:hypothetical protein AIGOOFII_0480 [Methylobacterium marchantiae]
MRLLGRLIWACLALCLAIPCGGLVLVAVILLDPVSSEVLTRLGLFGFLQGMTDLASGIGPDALLVLAAGIARAGFILLVLPPVVMALIGEAMGLRNALAYALGTGISTALIPWLMRGASGSAATHHLVVEGRVTALLFLAGAAAGLVYGWIAIRDRPAGA